MGLCFETLNQDKMAAAAYRQAWNALLEQRAARQKLRGNGGAFGDGADGGRESSGKKKKGETALKGGGGSNDGDDDDEIERIFLQAEMALTIGGSSTTRGTSRWSRGGTSQQRQRDGGTPGTQVAGRSPSNFERREHFVAAPPAPIYPNLGR